MKQIWNNLAAQPFGGAFGIDDTNINDTVDHALQNYAEINPTQFTSAYIKWINNSVNNNVYIDDSWHAVQCNGTTDAFDIFYMQFRDRRFVVLNGEYFYHKIAWTRLNFEWANINVCDDLQPNDALIISLPFSDTGGEHHIMQTLLDKCDELGIPVLLDCCYYGQCYDIVIPLEQKCIHTVAFSLSKCFNVSHVRIGMRLSRDDNDDPLFVYNKNGYVNKIASYVGYQLLTNFSADYIVDKYKTKQQAICTELEITPSNCVNLAISEDTKWEYLNRGNAWNRINITDSF